MARVYTHGIWTVVPGREDEFVAAWRELIPLADGLGVEEPTLLRDRQRPTVFRTFGAWPDVESIERFREQLAPRLAEMDELLESFEALTLDEVYPGE